MSPEILTIIIVILSITGLVFIGWVILKIIFKILFNKDKKNKDDFDKSQYTPPVTNQYTNCTVHQYSPGNFDSNIKNDQSDLDPNFESTYASVSTSTGQIYGSSNITKVTSHQGVKFDFWFSEPIKGDYDVNIYETFQPKKIEKKKDHCTIYLDKIPKEKLKIEVNKKENSNVPREIPKSGRGKKRR